MSAVVEVSGLRRHFGGIAAVDGIDLTLGEGEILAVLGPNGSGKTTLFNLISGFLRPDAGRVTFAGQNVAGWPAHRITRLGLARTFQQGAMFPNLSVRDNVTVPARISGVGDVDAILDLCGLSDAAADPAAALSFGRQRNLGIAIALATRPKALFLDEPGAGLGDEAARTLSELIRRTRDRGVSVAVIDHDMSFLLPIADRVMVLESGRTIFEGTSDEVLRDDHVIRVYLGQDLD